MDWPTILMKLGAALAAGSLVGLEREISGKAAGLRTNILICVGATTMAALGAALTQGAGLDGRVMADPQRMGAGIITGIGFLGAGSIIQARGSVRGLTSAATIWVLASIGLAIGAGYFALATVTTLLTVGTLFVLEKVERRLPQGVTSMEYHLEGEPDLALIEEVERCVRQGGSELFGLRLQRTSSTLTLHFVARASPRSHRRLAESLLRLGRIRSLRQG